MPLVIRAVALNDTPLTQDLEGRFDERGGSLGRSDDNTLTLPDPKRHISRRQIEVTHDGRAYRVGNVGSANPVVLNDRPVAPGESAALADGDELRIGAYRLEVQVTPRSATSPPPRGLPDGFRFDTTAAPPSDDVFEQLRPPGSAASGDIERLIGRHAGDDALRRWLNPSADASAEPAVGEPAVDGHRVLRAVAGTAFDETVPQQAVHLADRTPQLHAPMPLPRAVEPPPPREVPPAPPPRQDGSASDAQALWAAFCEGTGVPLAPPNGLDAALMREIGQMLRHLTAGTVKLLRLRASVKNEMRFPATMLRTHDNNPLRYSPNVKAALTQILQPPISGFMPGPVAAEEAMDDLFAHAVGTMAGMRAALDGVLGRFEPPSLEAKLGANQVLDALLPMHRRARLWDLYLQHHGGVRAEARDDFDRLFGAAFVEAYERQLDQLDADRRARRPALRA